MPGHALAAGVSTLGWALGWSLGFVVVLVVLALVIPILVLARQIGDQAGTINNTLGHAVRNTAPLAALRTTIEHATIIIAGLKRGRERLGG